LTKFLGLHATTGFYIKNRNLKLQRSRVYTTSAFFFVAEEGMINTLPIVEEGVGSFIAGVSAVDVAEATEGEIIDTRVGTNFFAFTKKAFNSARVRP
jgi:hypothetical protein